MGTPASVVVTNGISPHHSISPFAGANGRGDILEPTFLISRIVAIRKDVRLELRMRQVSRCALFVLLLFALRPIFAARDVPVPARCTAQVNQGLANLIASGTRRDVDNIMVCGVAIEPTRVHRGGPHGSHHITTIAVPLPNGQTVHVQVVTNDDLDGMVTAQGNDPVFAYGQGYLAHGFWAAGVHDVHCSTHPGADNGWVVVAGVKTPRYRPGR